MANARALDKRRKSIRNIRKITRTMELIATARFKKAMDRATAATAYTERMAQLVDDLARSGSTVSHPLLEGREKVQRAALLVLTANRGLCGGYNSSIIRQAVPHIKQMRVQEKIPNLRLEVSGKRGISALRFRQIAVDQTFTQFDDSPAYDEIEEIANGYLDAYTVGELDRVDVIYTRFESSSRQEAVVETLLPLGSLKKKTAIEELEIEKPEPESPYEFLPSVQSIIEEVIPTSFKMRLFKCFLDAAVSEQIARMVAMKAATENASDIIRQLSMTYNRARQSQITNEITEIIGGVEALKK
jgi:F-type H+-transporting ATPase subunit gamma